MLREKLSICWCRHASCVVVFHSIFKTLKNVSTSLHWWKAHWKISLKSLRVLNNEQKHGSSFIIFENFEKCHNNKKLRKKLLEMPNVSDIYWVLYLEIRITFRWLQKNGVVPINFNVDKFIVSILLEKNEIGQVRWKK